MRYSILTYEDGIITPIMPFIYDGEMTAYNTYEPKPIQHIKQMTMGYSGCIAAFKMADRTLTDMRDPTDEEKDACKKAHTFVFVPKLKKYRKKKEEMKDER